MSTNEEKTTPYTIRLTDSEVAAIRDMTKVDAVGPAAKAVIRKAIEDRKK